MKAKTQQPQVNQVDKQQAAREERTRKFNETLNGERDRQEAAVKLAKDRKEKLQADKQKQVDDKKIVKK